VATTSLPDLGQELIPGYCFEERAEVIVDENGGFISIKDVRRETNNYDTIYVKNVLADVDTSKDELVPVPIENGKKMSQLLEQMIQMVVSAKKAEKNQVGIKS
jgi:hypothetical protein